MSEALATATEAFEQTLRELGVSGTAEADIGDAAAFGRRAALAAAAGLLWRRHLGAMFDTRQVQDLLGGRTRQAVSDLVKRHRLLALPAADGRPLFPAFQFSGSGRPFAAVAAVLEQFRGAAVDPYTIASWFATPKALLNGQSPAGHDPQLVEQAARRTAARLSH
jgi:hypothetical protein